MGALVYLQTENEFGDDSSLSGGTVLLQPRTDFLDVSAWANGTLMVFPKSVITTSTDTVALELWTGPTLDTTMATSLWTSAALARGTAQRQTFRLADTTQSPMERYVFWILRVTGTAGPWSVRFGALMSLKQRA